MNFSPLLRIAYRSNVIRVEKSGSFGRLGSRRVVVRAGGPNRIVGSLIEGGGSPGLSCLPPFANNFIKCFTCSCVGCTRPSLGLSTRGRSRFGSVSLVLFSGIVTFSGFGRGVIVVAGVGASSLRTGCSGTYRRLEYVTGLVGANGGTRVRSLALGSRFAPTFSHRRCYRVIRGTGGCVCRNSVFRIILSGEVRTSVSKDLFSACEILEAAGPSPCVFCFSDGSVRVTNTSPRALIGLASGRLCAFPLTKAEPHKGARSRSLGLRRRLLTSRGRLTRRGVLISLNHGSVKEVSRVKSMDISGCLSVRGFSRMVRVKSAIDKALEDSLSSLTTVSSVLPTKALSNTPGVETYRVVGRLRSGGEKVCNKTVKCISLDKGVSAYVSVEVTFTHGGGIFVHSNTKVITSDIPSGRFSRYLGGTTTMVGTLGVTSKKVL